MDGVVCWPVLQISRIWITSRHHIYMASQISKVLAEGPKRVQSANVPTSHRRMHSPQRGAGKEHVSVRWTSTTPSLQISGLCHLRMSGEVCILDVLWHAYLSSPPCLLVRLPLCVHTPAFAGCYNHRNSINSQQEGPIKSLSTIQQPRLEGFINHGWLNTHDITNHNQLSWVICEK